MKPGLDMFIPGVIQREVDRRVISIIIIDFVRHRNGLKTRRGSGGSTFGCFCNYSSGWNRLGCCSVITRAVQ